MTHATPVEHPWKYCEARGEHSTFSGWPIEERGMAPRLILIEACPGEVLVLLGFIPTCFHCAVGGVSGVMVPLIIYGML